MEAAAPTGILEVDRLLDSSEPRPRVNPVWWMGGIFLLAMCATVIVGGAPAESRQALAALFGLLVVASVAALSLFSVYSVRQLRAGHQRVQQIGELVQLRRWPEAAMSLDSYLSEPSRTQQLRVQALAYLGPVLARLGRFDDVIAVQTHLIEDGRVDPSGVAALRIGRAMAMLHEDHLFDADRAISELRRGPAAGSAALALLEIYRDVKTGHPAEAVEIFQQKLPILRDQLGHRAADAYALIARAYDLLGREQEARTAFRNATLLAPVVELFRRYAEVQKLADRFQPAPAPPEAA
jgi:tetratricopeptide (TPR) repeat protein